MKTGVINALHHSAQPVVLLILRSMQEARYHVPNEIRRQQENEYTYRSSSVIRYQYIQFAPHIKIRDISPAPRYTILSTFRLIFGDGRWTIQFTKDVHHRDFVNIVMPGDRTEEVASDDEEESIEPEFQRPELGHLARWQVSSHKYGFGVDNLRDNNDGTFWQSEGPQPHMIDLSFPRRVFISSVALLTDSTRDDSYTPSKIAVKAGTSIHDLQEVRMVEVKDPTGWLLIALRPMESDTGQGEIGEGPAIPCHHLRIVILANHLNGKDTHVRGLKIFGSTNSAPDELRENDEAETSAVNSGQKLLDLGHDGLSGFTSQQFRMHEFIR